MRAGLFVTLLSSLGVARGQQLATLELRYSWDQRKFHNIAGGLGLGLAEKVGLKGTNPQYFPRITITVSPGRSVFARSPAATLE
jgi:hypothetical protein